MIGLTIYGCVRSIGFRKFLCGAFFVSGGIQLYLAFVGVDIPFIGTKWVQTVQMGYTRGTIHLAMSVVMWYIGFWRPSRKRTD